MSLWRPSQLRVSGRQAPETAGSPCCQANIVDRQKLLTGGIYRACSECGQPV